MRLWLDRLKVVFRTLAYREAWGFRPRQSLGMLRYLLATRPTWRNGEAEMNVYSPPVGSAAYGRYLRSLRCMGRGEWMPMVVHVSVTDRCPYRCARCSNVVQGQDDPPLENLVRLAHELRSAGTCRVALTGGEPLLRQDLASIIRACGPDLSPVLFTSGDGLDLDKARELHDAGLAAVFVSMDHFLADEHDQVRGKPGAFDRAVAAMRACRESGLYTAAQAVVGPSLLEEGRLEQFLTFCQQLGTHEVMLLEEVPVRGDVAPDNLGVTRQRLADIQLRSARDTALPKVSSMSWLESPDCLGCQAGFSFLYISAQGEVFPCDFVPVSFGNVYELGIEAIHQHMQQVLRRPSSTCLAHVLRKRYRGTAGQTLPWKAAQTILQDYDPGPLPRMMQDYCHDSKHSS